jgi:Domain of unknown function (DUF6798)
MAIRPIVKHKWFIGVVSFLAWSLVFGLIYAQSPLYTSNQNAYFLHGLADAGVGYLKHDWLATRQESMPVFTWLVYITTMAFHSKVPFYLYYALLMGVYLFSMFGIMDLLFDLRRSKTRSLVFLAIFLTAHSAALRFLLSRLISSDSTFLFEGGVAGQRILGQVFQPSTFGVLLVLSIYLFLRKRHFWALVPIAAAVYFHPVYLLGGALLTIAYMWIIFREQRSLKNALLLGIASLLLVSPALIYTVQIFSEPSRKLAQEALDILVNFRNPQHALVSAWLNWTVLVQALVLLAGLWIIRKTQLFPILLIVTLGVLILTILQISTANEWLALIFPWRVSVLLVPMGTTILIAWCVTKFMDRTKDLNKQERLANVVTLLVITGLMAIGVLRFQIESTRKLSDPALPMMNYVAAHKSPGDIYMIPSKMENFRLATGAPILVDFKSAPDRDADVMEWYQRLQWVSWFYQSDQNPCKLLDQIAAQYGVTHVVTVREYRPTQCDSLQVVYKDAYYRIFKLGPGK